MAITLYPQPGLQTKLMHSTAQIVICGGAMGCGKSYFITMKAIYLCSLDPNSRVAIFRKRSQNITDLQGLWDEITYALTKNKVRYISNKKDLTIKFPWGAEIKFAHLNYGDIGAIKNRLHGLQCSHAFVDEAHEISLEEFNYIGARIRTAECKIPSAIYVTTNPCGGWLKEIVSSYLNEDDYPDPEECKKTKYIYFLDGVPIVRDYEHEIVKDLNLDDTAKIKIQTLAFVPGLTHENKKLLDNNPDYMARLGALPDYDRERFLSGCWKELPTVAKFKREHFRDYMNTIVDCDYSAIFIDTALRKGTRNDYTAATYWAFKGNKMYLLNLFHGKWDFLIMVREIEHFIRRSHSAHKFNLKDIYIEAAGMGSGLILHDMLKDHIPDLLESGTTLKKIARKLTKEQRSTQALLNLNDHINVFLPKQTKEMTNITKQFLTEVLSFSDDMSHRHDDITDTFIDAINIHFNYMQRNRGVDSNKKFKLIHDMGMLRGGNYAL